MNTNSIENLVNNKMTSSRITLYINQKILPKSSLVKPRKNGISIIDSGMTIKIYTDGKRIDNDPEFLDFLKRYPNLIVRYEQTN